MAKVPSENVLDSDPDILRTVLQSLRGESRDYTSGKLGRAVILLAVPMVLEMLMESIFALADVFWVSRLGNEAVAVVGIAESIMTVVYAISIGLSMAGAAVVARRVGEKDREGAAEAAVQVILLGLVVSAVVGILGSRFALDLLRLAGADESVGAMGANYARIMLGGNATALLIFLINAVFRGAGEAAIAMRTLWLANATTIFLG